MINCPKLTSMKYCIFSAFRILKNSTGDSGRNQTHKEICLLVNSTMELDKNLLTGKQHYGIGHICLLVNSTMELDKNLLTGKQHYGIGQTSGHIFSNI